MKIIFVMKNILSDKMSSHKKSASENDLKVFVEATLQEYGVGITKVMTLKTLHQVNYFEVKFCG